MYVEPWHHSILQSYNNISNMYHMMLKYYDAKAHIFIYYYLK